MDESSSNFAVHTASFRPARPRRRSQRYSGKHRLPDELAVDSIDDVLGRDRADEDPSDRGR